MSPEQAPDALFVVPWSVDAVNTELASSQTTVGPGKRII
jgi:hypothetical protein